MRTHIVFFYIGDTIGEAVVSSPPLRLQDLRVFAYVPPLLQRLKQSGLRLGIISNTGPAIGPEAGQSVNAVLASVGLLGFFDPALFIYSSDVGLTKDDVRIFQLAAARAGAAPQDCLFVGEAAVERIQALAARHARGAPPDAGRGRRCRREPTLRPRQPGHGTAPALDSPGSRCSPAQRRRGRHPRRHHPIEPAFCPACRGLLGHRDRCC